MKKNVPHNYSDKDSTVKEISDGVYINLNRISSENPDFEKAIEESFKKLDENQSKKNKKRKVDQSPSQQ